MASIMVESVQPAALPVRSTSAPLPPSTTQATTAARPSTTSNTGSANSTGASGPSSMTRVPVRSNPAFEAKEEEEERRPARSHESLPKGDARTVASRAFKRDLPAMDIIHGVGERLSPQGLKLKPVMWNKDTDLVLRDLVLRQEVVDWNKIASTIEWDTGIISPTECQRRWEAVKDTPVKGPWSVEEDDHLKRLVDIYGAKKWNLLAKAFPGRSGKQCRERWHNHVDERVKKGEWTAEEDQILCEAQRQLGNKWSEMSRILQGRSENAIKNRFNSLNAKGLTETRANELFARAGNAAASISSLTSRGDNSRDYGSSSGYRSGDADDADMEMEMEPGSGLWSPGNSRLSNRGGSAALQALMVAATKERDACERGDVSFDRDNSSGGDWNSEAGDSVDQEDREDEFDDGGDSSREGGEELEGDEGSGVRRGTKRNRGAVTKMELFGAAGTGGIARRKRVNNPQAGMSILAQAAGILELESGERSNEDDESAAVSGFDSINLTGGGGKGRGGPTKDGSDGGIYGGGDGGAGRNFRTNNNRNGKHNDKNSSSSGRGRPIPTTKRPANTTVTCTIIGHGSTPPGSASPPPDASTPGGAGLAVGGGGEGGAARTTSGGAGGGGWSVKPSSGEASHVRSGGRSGEGACGVGSGKYPMVATAFAMAPAETVSVSTHHGSASYPGCSSRHQHPDSGSSNGGRDGSNNGSYGCSRGFNGNGGFGSAGAYHSGGGERGSQHWASGASSASPRSGWYVGPDGAYRRGLGSVPGPWRPYWKGEGFAVENGGVGTGGVQQQQLSSRVRRDA